MSDLSVFIDESGDVGADSKYYLVSLVFHEQSRPIDGAVARLGARLAPLGRPVDEAIHSGPLIRREPPYSNMGIAERRKVFLALYTFVLKAGIRFCTLAYRKSELGARDAGEIEPRLQARMARDLKLLLGEHMGYLAGFDRVIVYYDNGQHAVAAAVREAFEDKVFGVEFRRVVPSDYRLFQAADLVCTLELLRLKDAAGELSRGEVKFFGAASRLRKNYLRDIAKLRLG